MPKVDLLHGRKSDLLFIEKLSQRQGDGVESQASLKKL